jgi:hypothetical protein
MLWYRTEMLAAGIPMPAASASLPMPSCMVNTYIKVNKWWLLAKLRLKLVKKYMLE